MMLVGRLLMLVWDFGDLFAAGWDDGDAGWGVGDLFDFWLGFCCCLLRVG